MPDATLRANLKARVSEPIAELHATSLLLAEFGQSTRQTHWKLS